MKRFLLFNLFISMSIMSFAQLPACTFDGTACYDSGLSDAVLFEICPDPGTTLTVTIVSGEFETNWDDLTVYSGAAGSGTGGTIVLGPSDGDLSGTVINGNAVDDCLIFVANSDGSVSCASGSQDELQVVIGTTIPVPGCTTPGDANYDATATCDDGSCVCPSPTATTTGGTDCSTVLDPDSDPPGVAPLCGGASYPAGTGSALDADEVPETSGIDYGCLVSSPNPAWSFIEIDMPGVMDIVITNDGGEDIDYALWGPFPTLAAATGSCSWGAPLDCDYTTAPGGTATIPCAVMGDVYVLLVTNFSDNPTNISIAESGTATTNCAIVPVEFVDIKARMHDQFNSIEWSTASEINNQWQIVQRSNDGIRNWTEVGRIEGGLYNLTTNHYAIKDHNPLQESYYRVMSVDYDGYTQFSDVVSVRRSAHTVFDLTVYPNPTKNETNIVWNGIEGNAALTLSDAAGREFKHQTISLINGAYRLDMSELDPGIYFLTLSSGTHSSYSRIIKN